MDEAEKFLWEEIAQLPEHKRAFDTDVFNAIITVMNDGECRACGCMDEEACARCQQAKNKEDVREMQKGCAYLGCFVFIGVIIGILLALFMILPVPN